MSTSFPGSLSSASIVKGGGGELRDEVVLVSRNNEMEAVFQKKHAGLWELNVYESTCFCSNKFAAGHMSENAVCTHFSLFCSFH